MNDTNNTNKAKIVHEAEVQRQYVRLQLPVEVEIAGKRYVSDDWSGGGLSIRWSVEERAASSTLIREGAQFSAVMLFKFGLFDINIPVNLEVRHISDAKGRIGCRFANVNPGQQSLLQFIVNAYITGEIVRVGDVIDIVARDNTARPRSIPAGDVNPARRSLGWFAVMGATAALALYIGLGIWERAFVVSMDAAAVMSEPLVVEAPKLGRLFYQPIKPGQKVTKGTPLLSVQTVKGNMESVDSPCNCVIRDRLLDNHARVSTGDPVLRLISTDAAPYVQAHLATAQALRLKPGMAATIALPGGTVSGHVSSIEAGEGGMATVYVEPEEKLAADVVGGPATVRVSTLGGK